MSILARLFYLQVYLGVDYAIQSKKNYIRYESIHSMRGQIYDYQGNILATNRPIINLLWQPITPSSIAQRETIEQLCCICDLENGDDLIRTINLAQKRKQPVLLKEDISLTQLSTIEELFPYNPHILIQTDFKRYYPYMHLASHIIGYLSVMDTEQGKMGLEKMFDKELQGSTGTLIKTVNSYGQQIATYNAKQSSAGNDVRTTIDLTLQKLAESALSAEHVGTCIIMDPDTGAIRALVSRPNFDPTIFLQPLNPQQWQNLQVNQPFLNRAINCCYPPGSLFKLITISAALESGMIQSDATCFCKGFITYGGRNYWCNRRQGHGNLSVKQGLALSCNILFYDLGKKISIDTLADYAGRFGLGHKTGFLLHESTGLIPTTQWKRNVKGEPWWPGETLSASIGQSYLLTTPLQISRMISAIFTGYLIKPRILENEEIEKTPLYIQKSTLNFLKDSMRSVVTEGTGHRVNRIKDITIYAKTSTAQISTIDKRNLGRQYFEHGWVVAYFTYKDYKPLTLVVLVEHAGTSRIPVLIAKQFLLTYRDTLERNI